MRFATKIAVLCLSCSMLTACGSTRGAVRKDHDSLFAAFHSAIKPGRAVVWGNTRFYRAPSLSAKSFRVVSATRHHAWANYQTLLEVHVVADRGDFVEVRTNENRGPVCGQDFLMEDSNISLHLFVRKRDLVPVLTRPITRQFKDGTRLTLEPGLPAIADATHRGTYHLWNEDVALVAALPASAIGYTFDARKPATWSAERYTLSQNPKLTVGGYPVTIAAESLKTGFMVGHPVTHGATTVATIDDACMALRVATRKTDIALIKNNVLYGGVLGSSDAGYVVRKGAAVYWPNGKVAGKAIGKVYLSKPDLKDPAHPCASLPLLSPFQPTHGLTLRVCFRAADMHKTQ